MPAVREQTKNNRTSQHSGLTSGKEYLVRVVNYFVNATSWDSYDTVIVGIGTPAAPAAPISLTVGAVDASNARATVSWDRPERTERFSIVVATHDHTIRMTNIHGGYLVAPPTKAIGGGAILPTTRVLVLTELLGPRTYTVRAAAIGAGGSSERAITFTTPLIAQDVAPEAPVLSVTVTPDRIANPKATLSWTVEDNGTAITAFVLSYGTTQITITDGSATGVYHRPCL